MGENDIVLTNEQIAQLKRVESASDRVISPLQSLEDNLHGVVNYIILPLFAFVNAGVVFSGGGEVIGEVSIAVALGLLCGKFLGIYFFTWLAVKSKLTPMPQGMDWKNIAVVLMVLLSTLAVSQQVEGMEMLKSILKLGAFLIFWSLLGIYLIPSFLKKVKPFLNDETLLIIALGFCLGMVMIATKAGFSSALGAFDN